MGKIHVIGIGYKPFEEKVRRTVLNADFIVASPRLAEVFRGYEEFAAVAGKVLVINKIEETMTFIRENTARGSIALLASGDPMFFGIGRRVVAEFGRENVEIAPDLSSIQVAFARIGEPWDYALLVSLHGGPDPEKRRRLPYGLGDLPALLKTHGKIALLTDKENGPSEIARAVRDAGHPGQIRVIVCEKLCYPDERITSGSPEQIAEITFSEPNAVLLLRDELRDQESPQKSDFVFGLNEDELSHSRGLITKDEIRAASIHRLRLPRKGVFWDIGAGSGSISVEAALLSPGLKIYAIEKEAEELANIEENKKRFRTGNLEVTAGRAPEILNGLPRPDRVFIGGSAGNLSGIIEVIGRMMPAGIVVVNAVTLETLQESVTSFEENGFEPEVAQISISRSKVLAGRHHLSPLNPVFLIRGEKK